MNIRNQRGLTLTMLVITIVVMLILATILINFSIGDTSIFNIADITKFEEEIRSYKSRVDSEIMTKQNIQEKTSGVTLNSEEKEKILEEYYTKGELDVDNDGHLIYNSNKKWSKEQIKVFEKLEINAYHK